MPIFEGCLFSWSANKRIILIYIFWQREVVWERISCVYFRPRGSFSANFCPMFIAFLQPGVQSAIDRSLPTPPTNVKRWNQRICERFLLNHIFYLEALPKFQFLSCVDSLLTIGDRYWRKIVATFKKAESANSLPFAVYFHRGAYVCMGAYKRDVVVLLYYLWLL